MGVPMEKNKPQTSGRIDVVVLNKILYTTFVIFSIIYLLPSDYRPYPFSSIVKVIPILSLAAIAFFNIPGIKGKLIFIALLFSSIGDVLLSLRGDGYFVYGLSSFAMAHVFYASAFLHPSKLKGLRSQFSILFLIYGIVMGYLLIPNLGDMLVPVMVYIVLILCMGISSLIGQENNILIIIGAVFFVISDSIIAINMFVIKVPFSSLLIMVTYYTAQFLITFGAAKYNGFSRKEEVSC